MLANSWKLYAGNILMETLGGCWWLFDGGNYGTMLWHQNTVQGNDTSAVNMESDAGY